MASHFQDLLSCGICLDIYHHPKRLRDCPHTFCKKCLEPLVTEDGVINCPTCRTKNTLPGGKVEGLQTDIKLQETVESFLCVDCKTIDRFAKECDECHVKSCHLCICSHDSAEKCALLGSIRKLKLSLPAQRRFQEKRNDWVAFKEKNMTEKEKVDKDMTELIKALQSTKEALLRKFDEFNEFADKHIADIDETTKTDDYLHEIKNAATNMTSEAVAEAQESVMKYGERIFEFRRLLSDNCPDKLGTITTTELRRKMEGLDSIITVRQAGEDPESRVLLSVDASLCEFDDVGWPTKTVAAGQIRIVQYRGGRCELLVLNNEESDDVLKLLEWNNMDKDAASLRGWNWYHVPFDVQMNGASKLYTARIQDWKLNYLFGVIMDQLKDRS